MIDMKGEPTAPPWRGQLSVLRAAIANAGYPRNSALTAIFEAVIALFEHDRTVVDEAKHYIMTAASTYARHSQELARQIKESAAVADLQTKALDRLNREVTSLQNEIRALRASSCSGSDQPSQVMQRLAADVLEIRTTLNLVKSTSNDPRTLGARSLIQKATGLRGI